MISILHWEGLDANPNAKINAMIICIAAVVLAICRSHRRPRTTKLRGPPSTGFISGVNKELFNSSDLGGMYRNWEKIYGPVYQIPSTLGSKILVLQDPGAVTHVYSKDTSTYHQFGVAKAIFKSLMVSFFDGSCKAILSRPL